MSAPARIRGDKMLHQGPIEVPEAMASPGTQPSPERTTADSSRGSVRGESCGLPGERAAIGERAGADLGATPSAPAFRIRGDESRKGRRWTFVPTWASCHPTGRDLRIGPADRRESASIAARVSEIIAHLQAARAVECAGLERRIAELTLQLNAHADEVIALRLNLGHAEAENERLRAKLKGGTFVPDEVEAKLAAGAGAGEVAGD